MRCIKYRSIFILFCFISIRTLSQNITLRAQFDYPSGVTCANIWGHVDSTGKEYALVGLSTGVSVVDVTDPDNPLEVKHITGNSSPWREIRTYKNYAYVATEGGGGLQIVNLKALPSTTLTVKLWTGSGAIAGTLSKIHALHIDTVTGNIYLYGSNVAGIIVASLTDPWNPVYLGSYNTHYVHDGFVKNDTVYAAEISNGQVELIDFTNKNSPSPFTTQHTPGNASHNTWLSDNNRVMFTTDEVDNSFLTAYDISNFGNINELDRIQSNPGSNSVVHNCMVKNDYVVCSWYKDGVVIVDAHRPNNLVQVGGYDTFIGFGGGTVGIWGAYPYLPSGNIVASSYETDGKLYVLTPTYMRACYLEGLVKDSVTNIPIPNATVKIYQSNGIENTKINGQFTMGITAPFTYSVEFSKAGYYTKVISGVNLATASVTTLTVALAPDYTGIKEETENPFSVFPNPFTDGFTIKTTHANEKNISIKIYDVLGNEVYSSPINTSTSPGTNNFSILVNPLISKGVYFLKISAADVEDQLLKLVKTD